MSVNNSSDRHVSLKIHNKDMSVNNSSDIAEKSLCKKV